MRLIIQYLIFPLILTLLAFWTYFQTRELKKNGVKIAPFLWAVLVCGKIGVSSTFRFLE